MLPRQHRLIKEGDFNRTFRLGRSCFADNLGIKCLKNNLTVSRFGIIVSNKVAKKATQRNKIKRQIREVIHCYLKQIKTSYDFLIIARPSILGRKYQVIEREIKNSLEKLKVLQND